MGVFVSYSRKDNDFVEKLSRRLVVDRIGVWRDKWEMRPGDSLIEKIQGGMEESSHLLVVLSKHSVESEWCKSERNAGLTKEINSKKIVVIPILIDDCEIPILFSDKVYADFRGDFEEGYSELFRSLSAIANDHMGRYYNDGLIVDHSIYWGKIDDVFVMYLDFINIMEKHEKSFTLQLEIMGNEAVTERFDELHSIGMDQVMIETIINVLHKSPAFNKLNILLQNDHPYINKIAIQDTSSEKIFYVYIKAVLMGVDDGNDSIVHLIDYTTNLIKYREERRSKQFAK
nr:MAG TPA: TIR domain [Caudoviricetes sp.]